MEDLRQEIEQLRERTNFNRRQFLEADTETCFIAIARGEFELSVGNLEEAYKELHTSSHGADVIERFLRDADPPLPDLEARLVDLRAAVAAFGKKIETGSPSPTETRP